MTFLRRYLVLAALAFWQGGFTFYASVVVHIGRRVDKDFQSQVTNASTWWLNISGAIALAILALDFMPPDPVNWRRALRVGTWTGMLAMLGLLFWLHRELNAEFSKTYHDRYLWASTVQWGCGLMYLALTILTWRAQDRSMASVRIEGADRVRSVRGASGSSEQVQEGQHHDPTTKPVGLRGRGDEQGGV
jgi:hypothetical protein